MTDRDKQTQPSAERTLSQQGFEEFLILQNKELDVRMEELALQKQKDSNSFDFARESLGIKKSDREDQRRHEARQRKATYLFVTAILAIFSMVVCYSLFMGKEAFATEVIKTLAYIFTGGMGGYGIARYQAHRQEKRRLSERLIKSIASGRDALPFSHPDDQCGAPTRGCVSF